MKGTKNKAYPHALPTIEVETEEDARQLQIYFGQYTTDGRYVYTNFGRTVESLIEVTKIMQDFYDNKVKNNSQK